MGRRKDAGKKEVSKSEALVAEEAASESTAAAASGKPAAKEKPETSTAKATAKANGDGKNSGDNKKASEPKPSKKADPKPAKQADPKPAQAAVAEASKADQPAASKEPAKSSMPAPQASSPPQSASSRGPMDVALVLSIVNSCVLLALISGLGSAAYLARTGQLERTLAALMAPQASAGVDGLYALSAVDIDGAHVPLSRFAGKLTVVVNTATRDHARGYTQQNFERLNYLYSKYKPRGLEILAFPSNQFGNTEPGDAAEIKDAVRNKYNATFPLFSKVDVNGPNAHPVWRFLVQNQPKDHGYPGTIDWAHNKFVISKAGWPIVRYPLTFDNEDLEGIEGWISAHL